MIYKNAQLYNVADIETDCKDGGVTWYRMPKKLMDKFEAPNGKHMNVFSTGVEIRFVINSGTAVIRMQSILDENINACFHVYRGGIQGGYPDHENNTYVPNVPTDFVFGKPGNIDTLREMAKAAGDSFDPEVVRIIFDRGAYKILDISGDIAPPSKEQTPKKTLLCYGSSITHGSNSIDTSHTWASLLAHNLDMDLRNLGMAGSCCMEPEVIDYIASEGERGAWDMAVMELGINVLFWEESKIRERVENAVIQVAGRNKDKKVYIISPFYCGDEYHGKKEPETWRRIIKETVDRLAFENVTLINGLELLGDMTLLSADEIHPSIYGVQQIADRLSNDIKGYKERLVLIAAKLNKLTKTEISILYLLAIGQKQKDIAMMRNAELGTVKFHVHNILKKMNFKNTGEIIDAFKETELFSLLKLMQTADTKE